MEVTSIEGQGILVGDAIDYTTLGGEYLGWTGFPGWQNQAEYLGIHHIRWPAGINAEDRIESGQYAFDLSTPTLVDNWPKSDGSARDGLAEMFAYANSANASFAMIVPTARYVSLMSSDPAAARLKIESDITEFTNRLFAGEFGEIPTDFLLEIGAEYYSTDAWASLAHDPSVDVLFAEVFAELVSALDNARTAHGEDVYKIAVQAGRFQSNDDTGGTRDGELADSQAFLSAYSEHEVEHAIDALIWHRYVYTFEQTAHHLTPNTGEHTLSDHLSLWESTLGRPIELVLGWAAPDIDRESEYPGDPFFDYGPRAAHSMLQMFSQLAEAGADYATIYGIDSQWAGAVSTGTTNANDYSVSFHGEVYALMTQSLPGLWATDVFLSNAVSIDPQNGVVPSDLVNVFGFSDGVARQVTFAAAWDLQSAELAMEFLAPEFAQEFVTVVHLIPDAFDANAGGTREIASVVVGEGGGVTVSNVSDWDVVRVSFEPGVDSFEPEQITLNMTTGRGIVTLSDDADIFSFAALDEERVVCARDGHDHIVGSYLSDTILGGAGDDALFGGDSGDLLIGDGASPDAYINWLLGNEFEYL